MKYSKILLPAKHQVLRSGAWFVVLSFLLIGAGCSLTTTVNLNTNGRVGNTNVTANQNVNATSSVTYRGQDGKNALELLQADHQVDVSTQGFVNAIDSQKPGDRQFWAFYVNGQQAQVGAKEYQSKNNDSIEWKLEAY